MDKDMIANVGLEQKIVTITQEKKSVSRKESFSDTYEAQKRSGETLDDIFEEAARKYQVDVNLLKAIGKAESDFRPNLTSHAGAMGIMQIMPATAKEYGVTNPYDPRQNIMAGAREISELLKKYNGDLVLSLAGYNAGMGNVAKYGGVPPFRETRNYIKKVTEYLKTPITTGKEVTTNREVQEEIQEKAALNNMGIPYGVGSFGGADLLNMASLIPITYGQSKANDSFRMLSNSMVSTIEYQSLMRYMVESMALKVGYLTDGSDELKI